ncbi:MAG TPA: GTP cyclohydrolase I FolE [Planctomycetota bacterium]
MSAESKPTDPLAPLVRKLLEELGEDAGRQGLLRTPERVARSMRFLTSGYERDLDRVVNGAIFDEAASEVVLVKDIEFYSMCEHHLLPFYGKVHVGYIPDGRVIGLSKLPRIVEMFARRLQVQERMTVQVAEAVEKALQPAGVAVIAEAAHLCMMMRGVSKQSSVTTTSCMLGAFRDDQRTRSEFLSLVYGETRIR